MDPGPGRGRLDNQGISDHPGGDYLDSWLETIKPTVRPKTRQQHDQIVRQYVQPSLGATRLKGLRPYHVQTLYTSQLERGLGPRTVRLIHPVLHRALGQALRWGLVRRNVCDAVDKPKQSRAEMQTFDLEQTQVFMRAVEGHRLGALFHLAISTGLRQGELLGLKWTDLDFESGRPQVQRQLKRTSGQGLVFTEPKSAAGRRVIVLGTVDVAKLQAHWMRQLEERLFSGGRWQEHDLILPTGFGTPYDPDNISRVFQGILRASGVPTIRFHDLRHTAATTMLQQGTHPKIVQERLGHASIGITLDTYSHVLPNL